MRCPFAGSAHVPAKSVAASAKEVKPGYMLTFITLLPRVAPSANAKNEECFVSRAETERQANGFDKLVTRTDGLIQGELF